MTTLSFLLWPRTRIKDKDPWNHHAQNAAGPNKAGMAGIILMANETQEDIRACSMIPTKKGCSFTFQGRSVPMNPVGARHRGREKAGGAGPGSQGAV